MNQIIIIFLLVLSVWYTMQEGEIFEKLGKWLEKNLPKVIHQPVFSCNVCMTPWYGSVIYWLLYHNGVIDWIVTIISAMGLQVALNKFSPKKKPKPILEINAPYISAEHKVKVEKILSEKFPEYTPLVIDGSGVKVNVHTT